MHDHHRSLFFFTIFSRIVCDSTFCSTQPTMGIVPNCSPENAAGEESRDVDRGGAFDMVSLRSHLPLKRKGLSMHYSGKSRSFLCLSDAKSVDDLKKVEIPEAKRRKYANRKASFIAPSCRIQSSGSSCDQCVEI